MKLIIAIVNDDDARNAMDSLSESGYMVTKLCSSGGFLKSGNTTLLCGAEEDKIRDILEILAREAKSRSKSTDHLKTDKNADMMANMGDSVMVGGATVFITDVERFEKV
jgi:uncharacterized protein YaaQ